MPRRITATERQKVISLLAEGVDRKAIAERVGVTPGQVSAVAAHIKMGTYGTGVARTDDVPPLAPEESQRIDRVLANLRRSNGNFPRTERSAIPLGIDAETSDEVSWNPFPEQGSANPHVLILGESGFGKTYALTCLLAELAQRGVSSVVFDYGQGFNLRTAPPEFVSYAQPLEISASHDGIAINPLDLFPSDIHGPVNVAQRIADTFQRVYPQMGVQQHAVLRDAILRAFVTAGIRAEDRRTWNRAAPAFSELQAVLQSQAADSTSPQRRIAATVASHVSTVFVFNTFRSAGTSLDWGGMLSSGGRAFVIQLKGLEFSLERVVTEFLLWNLIGYIESLGPGPMRLFAVLDEAHKLAFDAGAPTEKLLREGRKFGIGLTLASQQPEDFSPVAFANTATKLVFQVSDERSAVSRSLSRKVTTHSHAEVSELITKLPRGSAFVVTENQGRVVAIAPFKERAERWKP